MSDLGSLIKTVESEVPDKGIYKVTQWAHDLAAKHMPFNYENLPAPTRVLLESIIGAFVFTKGAQLAFKVTGKKYPWVYDEALPVVERGFEIGIPVAAILAGELSEEGIEYWIHGKPLDNMGMILAYITGALTVEQDLSERPKEQKPLYVIKEALSKLKDYNKR